MQGGNKGALGLTIDSGDSGDKGSALGGAPATNMKPRNRYEDIGLKKKVTTREYFNNEDLLTVGLTPD